MKTIEELIKKACISLRSKKAAKDPGYRPSDEDIACYLAGLLNEKEKARILNYIASCAEEEEALRYSFLLNADIYGGADQDAPEEIVEKVKQIVPGAAKERILEAVVGFAENAAHVIRTTGAILAHGRAADLEPAAAFRDGEAATASKAVQISKAVSNYIVDVKLENIKKDRANLVILIKDKKNGRLPTGERIALVYGNRELMSSLTQSGRVEFDNIKLRDYRVNLVRKGQPICLAILSLRNLEE